MTMRELGSDRFRCASQIVQADLNSGPRLRPVQKQFLAWVVLISMLLTPLSVPAQGSSNGAVVSATGVLEVIQIDNFDTGETRTEYFVKEFGTGTLFKLRGGEQLAGSVLSGALVRVSGRLGAMRNGVQELIIQQDKSAQIEALGVGTFAMSGERRAVVLVVDFLDATAACSMTQIENGMYAGSRSVAGLFQDSSFNQLWFPGDVDADGSYDVFGPFTIDFIAGSCDAYYSWAEAADVAATAAGIDLSQYQHKIYVFPRYSDLGCEYAGRGNLGCARGCRSWILECESPMVYAHELGHNLGMHHAADSTWDYGDLSDPMGVSRAWHGFNAPHRDQMGWYDSSPESVIEVEAAGTYDVHALDLHPDDAGGPQVLKIWNPGTLDYYYLSFRRAAGYDGYLGDPYADRLNVHRYACCDSTPTYFVASLGDGETFEDAANEFRVTQLDRAGDVVTIQISFGGDSDADGVDDSVDNCPFDPNFDQTDTDGDGAGDACDPDDDNDAVLDGVDNCPIDVNTPQVDTDGDTLGDVCDTDDDGDGVLDGADNCPRNANGSQTDLDGDGFGDICDADDDDDGVLDTADNCPIDVNSAQTDTDGDSLGDVCDADDDGDGVLDGLDNCPLDADPSQTDSDGDGLGDVCDADVDGDGVNDTLDNCPFDANPTQTDTDRDGLGDVCDTDDDGDGVLDGADNCPRDVNGSQTDLDGDGLGDVCDADDDDDGVLDAADNCPVDVNPAQTDTDGDTLGDVCDTDDDGDGVLDGADNCPRDANTHQTDTDGDGLGDVCDPDDDNDGVEDTSDNCPVDANPGQEDLDADDVGDPCDGDDDGDLILDNVDNCPFSSNPSQEDNGGIGSGPPDGIGDACQCGDVTGDGVVNSFDATMIKRQALGLAAPLFDVPGNCDVTDDGACDSFDATVIIRTALGLSVPPLLQSCPNFVGAP